MSTRLYTTSIPATLSPTVLAGQWNSTTGFVRRVLATVAEGSAENITVGGGAAGPVNALNIQFHSSPLNGDQTISGAIKGRMLANESDAADNMYSNCAIWVMKSDGTSRGTLIAVDNAAITSEWSSLGVYTNRKFPRFSPVTPISVAALDGDRIIIEVGFRKDSASTGRNGIIQCGTNGSDLPENETQTASGTSWFEFTDTLSFTNASVGRVTQVQASVAVKGSPSIGRLTQVHAAVAVRRLRLQGTQIIWVDDADES